MRPYEKNERKVPSLERRGGEVRVKRREGREGGEKKREETEKEPGPLGLHII